MLDFCRIYREQGEIQGVGRDTGSRERYWEPVAIQGWREAGVTME